MRFVLCTHTKPHLGTRRLFFDDLAEDLRAQGIVAHLDRWDDLADYDVAIFKAGDLATRRARHVNPRIKVGIVHPGDTSPALERETRQSDFIISGSLEERDYYLKVQKNIFILPHIERPPVAVKVHAPTQNVVLGYHGNKHHLEQFSPHLTGALNALGRKRPIRLNAVYNIRDLGMWRTGRPGIPVHDVQWSYETVRGELLGCDIGLVPSLTPRRVSSRMGPSRIRRFDRVRFGRSPSDYRLRFKNTSNAGRAFLFMQLGIPVVGDMTPELCQALQHGRTGFIAYSEAGWFDAIEKLIESADLRRSIAVNAMQLLDTLFDRGECVRELIGGVRRLLASR